MSRLNKEAVKFIHKGTYSAIISAFVELSDTDEAAGKTLAVQFEENKARNGELKEDIRQLGYNIIPLEGLVDYEEVKPNKYILKEVDDKSLFVYPDRKDGEKVPSKEYRNNMIVFWKEMQNLGKTYKQDTVRFIRDDYSYTIYKDSIPPSKFKLVRLYRSIGIFFNNTTAWGILQGEVNKNICPRPDSFFYITGFGDPINP